MSHILCVIDFENLHIPCERATHGSPRDALIDVPLIMATVATAVGMPHVVRAYAPWHAYRAYQRALDGAGVERIDVTTKTDATIHRNAADLRIAIDVMDHIHDHPGCTVVIVGGDGGYTFLAMVCRRHGCQVHILAYPNTLAETLERAATSTIPWPRAATIGMAAAPAMAAPAPVPVRPPSTPIQQPIAVKPAPVPATIRSAPPASAPPAPLTPAARRRLISANIARNMDLAKRVAEAKAESLARAAARAQPEAVVPPPATPVPVPARSDIVAAMQDLGAGSGPCPVREVIGAMRRRGAFDDATYANVAIGRVFQQVPGVVITRDGTRTMLSLAA